MARRYEPRSTESLYILLASTWLKDFTDVVAEQNAEESLLAVKCTWLERWFSGLCRVVSQNYPTMACMPGKYSLFLVQFRLHMLMEN